MQYATHLASNVGLTIGKCEPQLSQIIEMETNAYESLSKLHLIRINENEDRISEVI